MPYEPLGIWLIDQWRKIGVNVNQEVIEAAAYYKVLRAGEHDVAMDFQCGYIVDPDLDLYKFLSVDRNPSNYSRYSDRVLDDLYDKQVVLPIPRSANSTFASSKTALRRGGALHYDLAMAAHHPA